MASTRLTVVGIRPPAGSIAPAGLHLRWMFPIELGFPRAGFRVFRRPAKRSDPPCVTFARITKGVPLPSGSRIGGVTLDFDAGLTLRGSGASWLLVESTPSSETSFLRMEFDDPVVEVRVGYARTTAAAAVVLRAHDERGRVIGEATGASESVTGGVHRLRIESVGIASATVSVPFHELHEICFLSEAQLCAEEWGRPVAELELLRPPSRERIRDLLASRLGRDVRNHYVRTIDDAEGRYGHRLAELLSWLHALVDDDPQRIANPGAEPHLREARPTRRRGPLDAVYPQTMLLMAALDPNVARMLSLGWVDRFRTSPLDPHEGGAYDYKVTGRWEDRELCGLVLELGASASPRPRLHGEARPRLLPGVRWQGTNPLRRVGVTWDRPPAGSAAQSAVQPVLFDVSRDAPTAIPLQPRLDRAARRPVLVPAGSWDREDATLFVDAEAPLGMHRYEVAGIDLFGQVSVPIAGSIEVTDLAPPPPPVRVAASIVQPGYPWLSAQDRARAGEPSTLDVRFEYGAFEHRQAPDASSVSLYWRAGSLVESARVTAIVRTRELVTQDRHAYVVDVQGVPDTRRFVDGVLVLLGTGDNTLPAKDRRRARIVASEAATRIRLAASALDLVVGHAYGCALVSDARKRDVWTKVPDVRVDLRPPFTGTLVAGADAGRTLTARAAAVDRPPPAAPLPRNAPAEVAATIDGVEVLLDRALLEPELFAGSEITGASGRFSVLSSTSGGAYGDLPEQRASAARLRLDLGNGAAPAPDEQLELQVGVADGARHVRYVEMTAAADPAALRVPGGQLAFEVLRGNRPALIAAQVVSDVRRIANRLGFLVRFPESLEPARWPKAGAVVRYFPPYAVEGLGVTQDSGAGSDTPLRLAIPPDRGTAAAYLALAAEDVRGNEGPLSAPVQITFVRPPPTAAPSAPFPCSDRTAADGFASPPDFRGRATACLEWSYAPQDGDSPSVRFEVGRTLDQTIIASDRRSWLVGRAAPGLAPLAVVVTGGPNDAGVVHVSATSLADVTLPDSAFADGLLWQDGSVFPLLGALTRTGDSVIFDVEPANGSGPRLGDASLYAVPLVPPSQRALAARIAGVTHDADRGLYRASVNDAGGGSLASTSVVAAIQGGCLIQGAHRFQITRAGVEDDLVLLLRPVAGADATEGACTIEPAPDYSRVAGSVDKLRLLAEKEANDDAFSLATGVPVASTRFRDEVPGGGRNAFFYRVRAVDPANNRSAWSPTSVPFWQVDTTPPGEPRNLAARPGDRSVQLQWTPPDDPGVTEYAVYRADGAAAVGDPTLTPPIRVLLAATSPARPTVVGGTVMLPRLPLVLPAVPAPAGSLVIQPDRTAVRPVGAAGAAPNLFVAESAVTRLVGRRIDGVNPYAPNGAPVRVVVGGPSGPTVLTHQPGTERPLTVENGAVDLGFGLNVSSVEAVVPAALVGEDVGPAAIAASPFGVDLSAATVDVDVLTIFDLPAEVPDGMAALVIVRLAGGGLAALRHTPGTAEPLWVAGGGLHLDLGMPLGDLLAVYPVGTRVPESLPSQVEPPDLRLMRPSRLLVDAADGLITGVADLNPLTPDGTTVSVTLIDAEGAAHVFDGDATVVTWRDAGLEGGRSYTYHLAAVKRVQGAGPSGGMIERTIQSLLAGPVSVVALDRSEPEPPVLTRAEWIDGATAGPAQPDTAQPVVRMTLRALATTTAWVRVQRAPGPEGPWRSAAPVPGPGWIAWPAGVSETDLVDEAVDPRERSWFRAQLRTMDDRMSRTSEPAPVEPLRGGSP